MSGKAVVVVTGAASGMGAAVARRLLRPDRVLLLADVDEARLAALRDDLAQGSDGGGIEVATVDVSVEADVAELAKHAASLGRFATLAHAAGISPTMSDWRSVLRVDLVGTALVLDEFRSLAGEGSVAVCWSSGAAHMAPAVLGDPAIDAVLDEPRSADFLDRLEVAHGAPLEKGDAYGWAKRGVIRLVRREAPGWGALGARVLSVSPGIVNTPMSRFERDTRPYMKAMIDGTPIPRMGTTTEIAELVAYLASPDASYITGTDILIDGGMAAAIEWRS